MLNYQNMISIVILIISLIIIYFISIKKSNTNITNTKVILYYNSKKELCLNIIDTIWRKISNKYNNINNLEFILIDINNNNKYSHILFNELPQIYIINQESNLLYQFKNNITYDNLDKFIIESMSFI